MSNDLSPKISAGLERALDQALGSATAAGTWRLDPQKSTVEIHARTIWGLVPVHGSFSGVEGGGEVESDGTVVGTLTIRADSLDTGNAKRDTHLRGKDFFDVENHPALIVGISGVDRIGNARLRVTGELQVRGAKGPIAFDTEVIALGDSSVRLRGDLVVDRTAFGLTWNQLGMITRRVTARVVLDFVREGA